MKKEKEQFDFKPMSKRFLKSLYKQMKPKYKYSEYIQDVKYLDGYFIFEWGNNAVLHFKLKDCPGWLFGVWWSEATKEEKKKGAKYVHGHFFAQYEEYINKFKPSDSTIQNTFTQITDGEKHLYEYPNPYDLDFDIEQSLNFIRKHPYLARYRDLTYTDFNYEYVSRLKAFIRVIKNSLQTKYRHWQKNRIFNKGKRLLNRMMIDEFANREFTIKDMGEHCSPRFEIYVPASAYGLEPGYYSDIFEDPVNLKRLKLYDKLCHKYYVWGYDGDMIVLEDKEYKKLKKSIDKQK